MAISEAARSELYTGLRDVIGPDRAETLMNAIPLYDYDEVVTKGDLLATKADLRADMADLRADMAEFRAELKGEIAELRAELKGEIGEVRAELKGDIADVRTEIGALRKTMTNWMLTVLVTVVGAMAGIAFLS